jgi:hypothetical protein
MPANATSRRAMLAYRTRGYIVGGAYEATVGCATHTAERLYRPKDRYLSESFLTRQNLC